MYGILLCHIWVLDLCLKKPNQTTKRPTNPPQKSQTNCGGLTLAGCQMPTKAVLSLLLLNGTEETKYNRRLVGRGRDRETSHSNDNHGQNRVNLRKINLIYYQSNQSRIMRNKSKSSKHLLPPLSSSWA